MWSGIESSTGRPSSSVFDKLSFKIPLHGYHHQILDVSCGIFVKHVGGAFNFLRKQFLIFSIR
jgi:hypothetical protein